MVNKESAALGFPGEELLPMDADHSSICKFDSNESPMCLVACGKIAAAVKRILSRNSARRQVLGQQTKAPAAGQATEHDPPEPPAATSSSSTTATPLGIKVLYSPADAMVEYAYPHPMVTPSLMIYLRPVSSLFTA